jgi:hypothetical protein
MKHCPESSEHSSILTQCATYDRLALNRFTFRLSLSTPRGGRRSPWDSKRDIVQTREDPP